MVRRSATASPNEVASEDMSQFLKDVSETATENDVHIFSQYNEINNKYQECAKLKQSVSRLATILFPELEGLVSSIHGTSIYALLSEYPEIGRAHV